MIVSLEQTRKHLDLLSIQNNLELSQDPRWPLVIENVFGHRALSLIAKQDDELLASINFNQLKNPFFGNSLISMPYLNGGSICENQQLTKEQISTIINYLKEYREKQKLKYVELRASTPLLKDIATLKTAEHKVKYLLNLPKNSDDLFKSFSKKLRNQIKKPLKLDYRGEVYRGSKVDEQVLNSFYQILAKHWRDLGSPVYPLAFFQEVVEQFTDQVILVLVKNSTGDLTSVSLSLQHGSLVEIIWAASLNKYHSDAANMFLYWKNLEYCTEQGIEIFDFGRSSKDSGGAKFKAQWGAVEQQLYWHYINDDLEPPKLNKDNKKLKLISSVWSKLPLGVCNYLGPKISRYLP